MKEKTFEELIKRHQYFTTAGTAITKENAIKLMQQVREATISECFKPYFNSHIGFIIIEKYKNGIITLQNNKKVYERFASACEAVEHFQKSINNMGSEYKILPITIVRDLPTDRIKTDK